MMLRKLSKTFKALALEKDAYAPWSLKGQIDYNLTPVIYILYSLKVISSTMLMTISLIFSISSMIILKKMKIRPTIIFYSHL
jgi:hypothetical protein